MRFFLDIITNFFVAVYKILGLGGVLLVLFLIELGVVWFVSGGDVFSYMAAQTRHLTVEGGEILTIDRGDTETTYHVMLDVANYGDESFGSYNIMAEVSDEYNKENGYTYISARPEGYYCDDDERTYEGMSIENYERKLKAERQAEYVDMLDSDIAVPGQTKTRLRFALTVSGDASDMEYMYIYDGLNQNPKEGYKLYLNMN